MDKNEIGRRHAPVVLQNSEKYGIEAETPDWVLKKQDTLSGTSSSGVLNQSKYHSKRDTFLKLVDPNKYRVVQTDIMLHGNLTEDIVKFIYNERKGVAAKTVKMLYHPLHPWLSATPDGLLEEEGSLIEIKSVVNRELTGDILLEYLMQMWVQMEVTGMPLCRFVEAKLVEMKNIQHLMPTDKSSICKIVNPENPTDELYYTPKSDKIYKLLKILIHPYVERNYEWFKSVKDTLHLFHKQAMAAREYKNDLSVLETIMKEMGIDIDFSSFKNIKTIRNIVCGDPFLTFASVLDKNGLVPKKDVDSPDSFMKIFKSKEKIYIEEMERNIIKFTNYN